MFGSVAGASHDPVQVLPCWRAWATFGLRPAGASSTMACCH